MAILLLAAAFACPAVAQTGDTASSGDVLIEEIVVTSQRRAQPLADHAGNIAVMDSDDIYAVGHQHIHELMTRVPGVWLSRGSGQEHLTAIRSPVLTGAGSCGGFLILEDGIPIRPPGFCNVNQMFELNTEQAGRIEVIRGPGNALYGSNALHGIINVLTPGPASMPGSNLSLEVGANQFSRLRGERAGTSARPFHAAFVYTDDGGFRDASGYRQGKLNLKNRWTLDSATNLTVALSATGLRQDTAGFIFGEDAYKDPELNRGNVNPEAFRDGSSQRLYAIWTRSTEIVQLDIRPYVRHTDMRFLQHFLPGQPLEENGHVSAGIMTAFTFGASDRRLIVGTDFEWSDIFLRETQSGPTIGSAFLEETRPEGKHYDYKVGSLALAPFAQAEFNISDALSLSAGVRLEQIRYDYENRMLSGNTRDDGSACGFGGCLYSRPESRTDNFFNIAPKLAISYRLRPNTTAFTNVARGFRAPQATELYRLQSGQQVADLDSETIDSFELGLRRQGSDWSLETSLFAMQKRDSVIRDAEGFNVSGGRSRHRGIELSIDGQLLTFLRIDIDASYARHNYDFDAVAARGEEFVSGNDIDTAPRWLGSVELTLEPRDLWNLALQWSSIGSYYLDAENRFRYPGHDLVNLRTRFEIAPRFSITARLNNALDAAYADRADYAFGRYRYFPGRGRELYVELQFNPSGSGRR
jgi:outer membrane receptor protein involved in Fe transport